MLVLSRKIGDQIRIGEDVVVEVLEIRGGRVRLGITAPRALPVIRAELDQSSGAEPQKAA